MGYLKACKHVLSDTPSVFIIPMPRLLKHPGPKQNKYNYRACSAHQSLFIKKGKAA